eukprot:14837358-Alexandrium_andersonii.AAC.1
MARCRKCTPEPAPRTSCCITRSVSYVSQGRFRAASKNTTHTAARANATAAVGLTPLRVPMPPLPAVPPRGGTT